MISFPHPRPLQDPHEPIPPEDKIKALMLHMWKTVRHPLKASSAIHQRKGEFCDPVNGKGGDLNIHGSADFNAAFHSMWAADGLPSYIAMRSTNEPCLQRPPATQRTEARPCFWLCTLYRSLLWKSNLPCDNFCLLEEDVCRLVLCSCSSVHCRQVHPHLIFPAIRPQPLVRMDPRMSNIPKAWDEGRSMVTVGLGMRTGEGGTAGVDKFLKVLRYLCAWHLLCRACRDGRRLASLKEASESDMSPRKRAWG